MLMRLQAGAGGLLSGSALVGAAIPYIAPSAVTVDLFAPVTRHSGDCLGKVLHRSGPDGSSGSDRPRPPFVQARRFQVILRQASWACVRTSRAGRGRSEHRWPTGQRPAND